MREKITKGFIKKMFECSKDGLGNRKHTYSMLEEVIEADF